MQVRGAPLIGATLRLTAMALARSRADASTDAMERAMPRNLNATRPTAVNLRWAIEPDADPAAEHAPSAERVRVAYAEAAADRR